MKDVQFIDLVLAFSPSWMIPSTWDSFLDVSGFRTSWVHELYQIFRRLKFGDSPSTSLKKNRSRPCQCKGSIEYVHLGCLRHWVSSLRDLPGLTENRKIRFAAQVKGRLNIADTPEGSYFYRPGAWISQCGNLLEVSVWDFTEWEAKADILHTVNRRPGRRWHHHFVAK